MTEPEDSLPDDIDLQRPNAARMYDYYLGGGANFAADRTAAKAALANVPTAREAAIRNRQFLRRAVEFCVANGIRQFLDIGAGIPTVGNTHEVAQAIDPSARVIYVDHEPVAISHAQHLLRDNPGADAVRYDLLDADALLADPTVRGLIDFDQPVAIMMIAVLHFLPSDERLRHALRAYLDALAPDSFLCISHITLADPQERDNTVDVYRASSTPLALRTKDEIRHLFDGTELVEPGVVYTPEWHPASPDEVGEHPEHSLVYAGVGRKPGATELRTP